MKVKGLVLMFVLLVSVVSLADLAYPAKCTVTFDANGGYVSRKSMSFTSAYERLTSLPTPTRRGYVFKYWTTTKNLPSTRVSKNWSVDWLAEYGKKTGPNKGYTSAVTIYAYWAPVAPKPSASDGKYSGYVKVKWSSVPGAVRYKVRRATSSKYDKSEVVAQTAKTSYNDKHPAKRPGKKYYYWIVPYDKNAVGTKDTSARDSGYARSK